MEKNNHHIGIKYDSLIEAILVNVTSEKQAVFILNELYNKYNLFNPKVFYLGDKFVDNSFSYLIDNKDNCFLITINKNSNILKTYDLYGNIESNKYYVSTKPNIISIVYDNSIENIILDISSEKHKVTWEYFSSK